MDQARLNAANLTLAVAEHVTGSLGMVDRILLQLKQDYEKHPETFGADEKIRDVLPVEGMVIQAGIIGSDGYLVASTLGTTVGRVYLGDRDHVRGHADADTGTLLISQPIVGRNSGRWSLNISRRLNRPDGSYGGVAVVSFDPDYLANFFRSLDLGPQGAVAVIGRDMVVRAGTNLVSGPRTGRSLMNSPLVQALARAPNGSFIGKTALEGIDRIVSYRTLIDYPLIVATGLASDGVLADFYQRRVWLVLATSAISLIFLGIAVLRVREIYKKECVAAELVQTHHRFKQMIDTSPMAFISLAPDRRVLTWNPRAEQIFGYTAREIIGQPYPIVPLEKQTELDLLMELRLTGNVKTGVETQRRSKDGTLVDVRFSCGVIRDERGKVCEIFMLLEDITERKQAEHALQASEARFRGALEASPDAMIVVDATARIILASPRIEVVFGYKPEDIVGKPFDILMPERYREAHASHFRGYFQAPTLRGMGTGLTLCGLRCDGSELPVEISLSPYQGEGHQYVIAVVRDITERKKAETEVQRWFEAFSKAEVGLAIADAETDNVPIMINPVFARLFRGTTQDLIGAPRENFYAEKDRDRIAAMHLIADSEGHASFEATLLRQDGTTFEGFVSITSVPAIDGESCRRITTVLDITKQRQAEDMLRQAQKMEAVGQLTGGIAHDFNNLLTTILGNVELLEWDGQTLGAEASELIAAIRRAGERAARLTQQMLAFSRKQALRPEVTDGNLLVSGISKLLRRTLGEHVIVEVMLTNDKLPVHIDANQLENALLNLAINARDAMPSGGKLTIEADEVLLDETYAAMHDDLRPGQYVMLAVSDTGTGMTEEALQRAFEPFYTTKPVGEGTGLGLSQVYGFVKQSGGHIQLYSEPGLGTTVRIYLPRHRAYDGPRTASTSLAELALPRGTETVLVVEDEEAVRDYSTATLRRLGYHVLTAENADAALAVLGREPAIALMFTDVGLPGRNGRELADEAWRRYPGLKVLFTSGYARNAMMHNGTLDHDLHLLTKPFTVADVARRIRDILDQRA